MAKKSKKICTSCGKDRPSTEFYASRSKVYAKDEQIPICKACYFEIFEDLVVKYDNDEVKALYHLTMMFDIYFSRELVERSYMAENYNEENKLLKAYMKNVNSLKQYKFMDSFSSDHIMLSDSEEIIVKSNYKEESVFEVTKNIRRRWGKGYTDDEYEELEYFYEEYKKNLEHENNFMKLELIKEMCTIKLIRDNAQRDKNYKVAKEYSDLLSKKMADANLKPSQQKVLGEASDDIFGVRIRIYEQEEPLPTIQESLKDVDKFWKYILRYLIKPFAMALDLAKGSYSIEEGDQIEIGKELKNHINEEAIENE